MAESSGDGAAPLMLSRKKRKLEGEPGEGEDPLKGSEPTDVEESADELWLVNPLTSADPDLDISTSVSKSTQVSNPDLSSSIDFEEANKKDDHGDYDDYGGRATTAKSWRRATTAKGWSLAITAKSWRQKKKRKFGIPREKVMRPRWRKAVCFQATDSDEEGSKSSSKPKLGGPEGEDLNQAFVVPVRAVLDPHKEGSKSGSKPKLGEPEGEDVPGLVKTRPPAFSLDHILGPAKGGEAKGKDLQGLVKTEALPRIKVRAFPRLQKKLKLGEPEGEDQPGEKDPSLCVPFSIGVQVPSPEAQDPDMEDSKSGSSVVSTQASNTFSGELLPLEEREEEEEEDYTDVEYDAEEAEADAEAEDEDEDEDEDDDDDDDDDDGWRMRMTEEGASEWFDRWIPQDLDDERPKSPGWGYSDVDENDPHWHDKFVEKIRRQTPPKYKAAFEKDYCPVGVERKDEALWGRYLKQIEESDGYDITDFPGVTIVTPITPVIGFKQCPPYAELLNGFTDAAITEFNSTREENDQYEVHDILTVNVSVTGARRYLYFITFEAKKKNKNSIVSATAKEEDDHGGAPLLTTFQARVLEDKSAREVKVEECRIKAQTFSSMSVAALD